MKKIIISFALVVCTIILSLTSCKNKTQAPNPMEGIEASVKADKAKVPYQINENTTLVDCYLTENTITYKYEVKSEVFKAMDANKQKENTVNSLKTNLNSQAIRDNIKKTSCSLRYVYTDNKDSVVFTVTPSELN